MERQEHVRCFGRDLTKEKLRPRAAGYGAQRDDELRNAQGGNSLLVVAAQQRMELREAGDDV